MRQVGSIPQEVLLALAEEIRQTIGWLALEDGLPEARSLRFRLRTLREAAVTAHLTSVETVLAELESRLAPAAGKRSAESGLELEEVLERLSDLLVALAEPASAQGLVWVEALGEVEAGLQAVGRDAANSAQRIDQLSLLANHAATADEARERTRLLLSLGQSMRQEIDSQRCLAQEAVRYAGRLRQATRQLTRELAVVHRVPLAVALLRLREHARRSGREQGRPVALQIRCGALEVGAWQLDPLSTLLEFLVDAIVTEGLEAPQQRRHQGKPTVASITLDGGRVGTLLRLTVEDDGLEPRPEMAWSDRARRALLRLRARLWCNESQSGGQRLLLELPLWSGSLEALPLRTSGGETLVPLGVIERVHRAGVVLDPDLPVLNLARRAGDDSEALGNEGVICALGTWRALLPGVLLGAAERVVPMPAEIGDPAWVVGQVTIGQHQRPLFHPLAFANAPEGHRALSPPAGRRGGEEST